MLNLLTMNLLGYSVLLMLWGCCRAQAPCGRPESRDKEEPTVALVAEYTDQTVLTYNCRPGYRKLGRIQYKCNNGEWQRIGTAQCTEKPCGHPGDIVSGTFQITKATEFVFGARVEYTCDEGYQMISRLSYRDCTATGWSNSVPFCESRKCVPFLAPKGGKIVATGTHQVDDEASVGHVLRFACDSPTFIPVPKEVYCTREGEWSNARVECKEIICEKPVIQHGIIRSNNNVFKKDERLDFECEPGHKSEGRTPECTETGWNPDPVCKAILCLNQIVEHGEIMPKKDSYREGEVIKLNCHFGFEAKNIHNSRPTCTASGWVPPLLCESKACGHLKIGNGKFSDSSYDRYPEYYFPMPNGKRVDYVCNYGFSTESGYGSGSMTCTRNGWSPPPKCLRTCLRRNFYDMDIFYENQVYTVGTTASYKCHKGFTNAEGSERGILECLPNGQFSEAKCTRSCRAPSTSLKNYKPSKNVFFVNERLQYECEDGYKSQQNNLVEKAECVWWGEWRPTPKCQEITCSVDQFDFYRFHLSTRSRLFKDGDVVKFDCNEGYTLKEAEKAQCYYFGWYPKSPRCEDNYDLSDGGGADAAMGNGEECPQAPILINTEEETRKPAYYDNDTVTYKCKNNYILYGSKTITCQNGHWTSPPQCIETEQCSRPPFTRNGKTSVPVSQRKFYSGDTVTYICDNGYGLRGSNESICIGGYWQAAPTCTEIPCDQGPPIEFGSVVDSRPSYAHGSTVQLQCDFGYTLSFQGEPKCEKGKWLNIPQCKSTACGPAPQVQNANFAGPERPSYLHGETVDYKCITGFVFEKFPHATCNEGEWMNPPVCKKIGDGCGPAPSLANGDVEGTQQRFYKTDTSVKYKCQNYHLMVGSAIVTCRNGAWSTLPDCLEPCTASAEEMAANNLRLAHRDLSKLYSEHGDTIEFSCIQYYIKVERLEFRVKCNRGKLLYPKCIKPGSCVASSSEMDLKNIILQRENVDIPDGESVVFSCKPGFFQRPNKNMRVSCLRGNLDYPECDDTPPACSGPPSIQHGSIVGVPKQAYSPDSIVEYACDDDYVLEGTHRLKCIGGGWSGDAPTCIGPCHISSAEMNRNNLEMHPVDSINQPVKHKTSVDFRCKEGYIEQPSSPLSTGQCNNGTITYPLCILDSPCQVTAEKQDEHGVELKRKSKDTGSFIEGASIEFICKAGFKTTTPKSLTVKCTADGFEYPTCISTVPCRLTQEAMDEKQLELHEKHNGEVLYTHGQTIEFKCKSGLVPIPPLSVKCIQTKITYPTCVPANACFLSRERMAEHRIQLLPDTEEKKYLQNSEQITFSCKEGFQKHPTSSDLTQKCVGGSIAYPKCINSGTWV